MRTTIDSNIILRSLIDEVCSECFIKFYHGQRSFLCFTVNQEIKSKQEKINSFLETLIYKLEKTKKNFSNIKKMNFFEKFSEQFEEIFNKFKDVSDNFRNISKLKKIAKQKLQDQQNYIIMRESMHEKRLWPKNEQKAEAILNKKEIRNKRKQVRGKVPDDDSRHLAIAHYYGNSKAYEEVLFVSADEKHIIKNRELIEKIFDIIEINSSNEYTE